MEQLPFIPNQILRRKEIHSLYGGNPQSGISPSAKFPYIFIFSGSQGKAHGYQDSWDSPDVYSYSGAGQIGDMKFTMGNLALRDHKVLEKRVFLFDYVASGTVKYISELEVLGTKYFEIPDSNKKMRIGIRFFFQRVGINIPKVYDLFKQPSLVEDFNEKKYEYLIPNTTERKGLVTSRVGQGAYRTSIIIRWDNRCAVTGFDKKEILIASHIHPWKDATDKERLDVHNGILLSPTYDALFDKHLISFENTGKIILSNLIESQAFLKIGVTGDEKIQNLSHFNLEYLEKHRVRFGENY
jgi:5-methylcytosine-specific restriction protein A